MVVCVGENINVMSKTIGPAMKERQAAPILEMAKYQEKAGIDYLDLNIGPSRKAGPEAISSMAAITVFMGFITELRRA